MEQAAEARALFSGVGQFSNCVIKSLQLALSCMHETYELSQAQNATNDRVKEQYTLAIKHAKHLLDRKDNGIDHLERVLTTCTLFATYETVAGNYSAAAVHFQSGRDILKEHSHSLPDHSDKSALCEISHMLAHLDMQAMVFADESSPYKYDSSPPEPLEMVPILDSLTKARDVIVNIIRHVMWTVNIFEIFHLQLPRSEEVTNFAPTLVDVYSRQADCIQAIENWWRAFHTLDIRLQESPGGLVLRMHAMSAQFLVRCLGNPSEADWDGYMSQFQEIVRMGEKLPSQPQGAESGTTPGGAPSWTYRGPAFTPIPETGPIMPLFLTAIKCRDPLLRQKALDILHSINRKESAWESLAAAKVATLVIEAEEGLVSGPVNRANDVTDDKRCAYMKLLVRMRQREIDMQAYMRNGTMLATQLSRDSTARVQAFRPVREL
ncbi:uncharacterized protein Z518_04213 [Rhinocladiella mackenziei CBS 650.93]|uniref:Uncharacterized protein n=1 Tax=Rhinocladiella mackenziei CBS 650.93 TaxID=1442369 RepID=A0A0D2H754_9EURO|nr:uncharacterized protein Z518_04213 [Rhinocladiella mackenziei CBS 650.93]KIX06238.1 hypothetical protein Z518_04213 [Rhinocladiella mackenziei CBS 650.93]